MVDIAAIKKLREETGAGPLDAKKALEGNDGDYDKAVEWLIQKGISKAKKQLGKDRAMSEGMIEVYQHFNNQLAVIVEVNCETDFVADTDAFKTFAKDVALHISSMRPEYVSREDVPEDVVAAERELLAGMDDLEGKPDDIKAKIIDGRMEKWFQEKVLMEQEFLKDDSKTIAELLEETVAEVKESIQIRRFARFAVGESLGDDDATDE